MSEPTCTRTEVERLGRWDSGAQLDYHERGCEACQQARQRYKRLAGAFRRLPEMQPPAGWEERVLSAVERQKEPDRRPPARWIWALAAALALAVAAIVILRRSREPLALRQEVVPAASGRRGDMVVVGDRLRLRASTGGAAHAELRLYRGERDVVLRCPGDARCRAGVHGIEAELTLELRGSYRALLITADAPLPGPTGSLDGDARAANALRGRVDIGSPIDVE